MENFVRRIQLTVVVVFGHAWPGSESYTSVGNTNTQPLTHPHTHTHARIHKRTRTWNRAIKQIYANDKFRAREIVCFVFCVLCSPVVTSREKWQAE